jgi:hypothetical protein
VATATASGSLLLVFRACASDLLGLGSYCGPHSQCAPSVQQQSPAQPNMGGKPSVPAVDPKVAEDGVRAALTKAYESSLAIQQCKDAAKVQEWIDEYYTPKAVFIRPSGNPMGLDMMKGMWVSEDVVSKASELKAIESVNVFCRGTAATVVCECCPPACIFRVAHFFVSHIWAQTFLRLTRRTACFSPCTSYDAVYVL